MKVYFYTLGCRLNQAETDSYQEALAKKGFAITIDNSDFDIAVVNTCAVTHKADREARQSIRKIKRQCPKAKIVMTGCSSEKLEEVDYYIKDKENFVKEFIKIFPKSDHLHSHQIKEKVKVRANIKIQTGCDNHCTYCYTRIPRGRSRSFSPNDIIRQIKNKEKQGVKEVILTGVNIGQYSSLIGLIKNILKETNIPRIRLSSINPEYVYDNKEFKNLFKNPRVCQHLHLSLQSGSDAILKKMNRHYTSAQYLKIVRDYYKAYPLFGFTTDVIIGFPGETEKDFKQTCALVKKCGFLKIHIFRYSKRQGTPAAKMPHQVPENIKKQRLNILEKINQDLQKKFRKKMKGKKLDVLFEGKVGDYLVGHAGNYLFVKKKYL
ncbi:MAG: tRNA (N(6)-L-threonylcarbamoyladenosine(37)-C(2))-methylthiotransferase MtaB [Patescibacteria group bacterium]|jgi:threonylcarbamoyladenosine tRNA methylthiotransferase MtaB